MKVRFSKRAATIMLANLRSLIDGGAGGSLAALNKEGAVLWRVPLSRPCADDPVDGVMEIAFPEGSTSVPERAGDSASAVILDSDGDALVEFDIGEEGSGAAVEVNKMKVRADDLVRFRSKLVLNW